MIKKEQATEISVDIEQEAINLIKNEWRSWEDAIVYVTDKVAFNLRNLVKTLRKNYWGIFDNDTDPVSGKKLTWIPATEWFCDTYTKNADINSSDLNVRAKNRKAIGLTALVRQIIKNWMDKEVFGEDLDETIRQLSIDGSHIWKTFEGEKKGEMIRRDVDILNAYFDFTSESIQKAYRFTERALLTPYEISQMDGWINTEDIKGSSNLHPTDTNLSATTPNKTSKYVDVWETWGRIPYYLITGNREDTEEVEGHIVVSCLQGNENPRVHLIETNPKGLKPYEEAHTKKVRGRWLGRGPAESVMFLQSWLNMIVNVRKLRAQVSQLGIFKMRKGANVSPQQLSRMAANGVLTVNNMDDIEQFVMQDASPASYKDEDIAVAWGQRVTSSYESVTGEQLPASTPATNAVIQSRASGSTFRLFRDQIGFFLTRWMQNHGIPILVKRLTIGEVIRMTGEVAELEDTDEIMINYYAKKKLEEMEKDGKQPNQERVLMALEEARNKLRKLTKDRFVEIADKINVTDYDVDFYVTNEEMDIPTMSNNLINALKFAPEYRESIIKHLFDLMGLDTSKLEAQKQVMPPQEGQMATNPTEQQIVTNANVPV